MRLKIRIFIPPVLISPTRDGLKTTSKLNARRATKSKEFELKQTEILALQDPLSRGANS